MPAVGSRIGNRIGKHGINNRAAIGIHGVRMRGGLNMTAQQGMFGGHTSMGAAMVAITQWSTITVTPKLSNISHGRLLTRVWATEAGVYGLPSKCSFQASRDTRCDALYQAILEFAQGECNKAAEGLAGQMQGMGAGFGAMNIGITWTPVIETLSFEGIVLPRDGTPIGNRLQDGVPFQASGKLHQSVNTQNQSMLGAMTGVKPDTTYTVADAMFNELDQDGSGALDPEELVVYLLNRGEAPSSVQALFSTLDTNADGKVTKEEWRAGWLQGTVEKKAACCVVS